MDSFDILRARKKRKKDGVGSKDSGGVSRAKKEDAPWSFGTKYGHYVLTDDGDGEKTAPKLRWSSWPCAVHMSSQKQRKKYI